MKKDISKNANNASIEVVEAKILSFKEENNIESNDSMEHCNKLIGETSQNKSNEPFNQELSSDETH